MTKITREFTGQIVYKGHRLDMCLFCVYLHTLNYGKPVNKHIVPSQAKERHIVQFLKLEGIIS